MNAAVSVWLWSGKIVLPSLVDAQMPPPCKSVIAFAIDNPIPYPPVSEFLELSVL